MLKNLFLTFCLLIVCLLSGQLEDAHAQGVRESFGKNRIQYKTFDWQFYSTDNFDVYYYNGGKQLSQIAIEYLQKEFEVLSDLLGHQPYFKSKIFLYNSLADLQQSNVGVNNTVFKEGGQTNFIKSYVEIAFPGTVSEFKKELKLQVSKMMINDEMYGGDIAETFQNGFLLKLPDWYIDGAARYLAYGWDVEMDDYIRDLLSKRKNYKKLSKFTGDEAAIIGQSIWNYIAQKYKKSSISYIMNLTRIVRDEEKSIATTLGLPGGFKQLINQWESYYLTNLDKTRENYFEVDQNSKEYRNRRRKFNVHALKFSPDGSKIAFARHLDGVYSVVVRDLEKNKEKVVFSGGSRLLTQKVHQSIPLISWKDDETLGIISVHKGKYVLWLNRLKRTGNEKKVLYRFSQVTDFNFSKSGNLAVLSGEIKGKSDVFVISLKRNGIKRVTNDIYDDRNPTFVPGRKQILFSSNRPDDDLKTKNKEKDYTQLNDAYNLFVYDLDTTNTVIKRVTNTLALNEKPFAVDENEYLYISDVKGIKQLYLHNQKLGTNKQVTKKINSITSFDYHRETNKLAYITLYKGKQRVYVEEDFDKTSSKFTLASPRVNFLQANSVLKRLAKRKLREIEKQKKVEDSINQVKYERLLEEQKQADSLRQDSLNNVVEKKTSDEDLIDTDAVTFSSDDDFFNTDDYVFSQDRPKNISSLPKESESPKESVQAKPKGNSFLDNYLNLVKKPEVVGPLDYQPRFTADNLVTTWLVDPMRGFGVKLETRMSDILENNHFYGGIMTSADFRSGSDLFVEYEFLKYKIDFRAKYLRQAYNRGAYVRGRSHFNEEFSNTEKLGGEIDEINQKFVLNKFEIGASWPISVKSRITFTPFLEQARILDLNTKQFEINNQIFKSADATNNYLGFKFEYVFDNAVLRGLNILDGTRAKISYESHMASGEATSFSKFKIDLRHYQPIHKEITWASRLFYGRNTSGIRAPKYLVGGVDNWLFNDTEQAKDLNDPLLVTQNRNNQSLVFHDYVLNLRGVRYNKFYGSNAILFNSELRVPLIQYLTNGPITSNFMRNLLFVAFFDVGTAWEGSALFPTTNSLNEEIIVDPEQAAGINFQAIIDNFNSPWLASTGVGVRTVVLGFYTKLDVAWPYENFAFNDPIFHVSLGYDF